MKEYTAIQRRYKEFNRYELETLRHSFREYLMFLNNSLKEYPDRSSAICKRENDCRHMLSEVESLLTELEKDRMFIPWKRSPMEAEDMNCHDKECPCQNCFNNLADKCYPSVGCKANDCPCVNCEGSKLFTSRPSRSVSIGF